MFTTPRKRYATLSLLILAVTFIVASSLLGVLLSRGGYYFHGGAAVALAVILPVAVAASFALSLIYRRDVPATHAVFGGHLGATLCHLFFTTVILLFGGYHIGTSIALFSTSLPAALSLLFSGIFAVCGFRFTAHSTGTSPMRALLSGASLALSCVFYALHLYFDTTAPKNATLKHLLVLTFLVSALFFLSEIRRILEKKPNLLYRIILSAVGPLCAALSLAPLLVSLIQAPPAVGDIPSYLFLFALFLYIVLWTILPHYELVKTADKAEDSNEETENETTGDTQ